MNGNHSFLGLATAGIAFSTVTPTLVVAAFSTSPQSAIVDAANSGFHPRPLLLHRRWRDLADGHDLRRHDDRADAAAARHRAGGQRRHLRRVGRAAPTLLRGRSLARLLLLAAMA